MQKAEVTPAPEAFGQDMLERQPEEDGAWRRAGFGAVGLALTMTEGDLVIFAGEDALLLAHAAVPVAAQIEQGLLARTARLAVHDPGGNRVQ